MADMELRHRRRNRCEDRIRISKDTALMNLPSVILSRRVSRAVDLHRYVVDGVLDVE